MTEPEAAVAIVRACGARESILLMRRAEREGDSWSGHWSFPGGRRDPQDADLLHTALRELEEECGIRLAPADLESTLPRTVARRRTGPHIAVAPFVFRVSGELKTRLDPREAAHALWIPMAVLLDSRRHVLTTVPGRSKETLFPAIQLEGAPLWGFTYRLMTDWLGLGPQEQPVERAGFEAACQVLEFLLTQGLTLDRGWEGRTARVKGAIPVAPVVSRFAGAGHHVAPVNYLDVRGDCVRIAGPAFEEYCIYGSEA